MTARFTQAVLHTDRDTTQNPASHRDRPYQCRARLTRREEGAYSQYVTDEQRSSGGMHGRSNAAGLLPQAASVRHSLRNLPLKDSSVPCCQGVPGSMKAVSIRLVWSQRRIAGATNSGPLSERRYAATPCTLTHCVSTSMTRPDRMLPATSMARHSRVYRRPESGSVWTGIRTGRLPVTLEAVDRPGRTAQRPTSARTTAALGAGAAASRWPARRRAHAGAPPRSFSVSIPVSA